MEINRNGLGVDNTDARPLPGDKRLLAHLLQKAVHRGDVETASRAGASLWERDRKLFWRRLRAVAIQDVGIGNLPLVYEIGSSSGNQRTALGWVRDLAGSVKCAAPFDQSLAFDAVVRIFPLPSSPDVQGVPLYVVERELCGIGPACIQAIRKAVPGLRPYTVPQIAEGLYMIEGRLRDKVLTSPRLEAIAAKKHAAQLSKVSLSPEDLQTVQDVLAAHWQDYQDIRAEKLRQYLAGCVWRA